MSEPTDSVEQAGPELGPRWGRGRWAAWWAVGTVLQAALGLMIVEARGAADAGAGGGTVLMCAVGLVVLQIAKSWGATRRLADLGRPSDDVIWAFVPIANLLLAVSLFARAPGPKEHARRVRAWSAQLSALRAWKLGLTSLAGVWPVALAGSALVGGVAAVAGEWVRDSLVPLLMDPAEAGLHQGMNVLAAFLAFYTVVHLSRASTRSIVSWWPVTLLAPLLLFLVPGVLAGTGSSATAIYVGAVNAGFDASLPSLLLGGVIAAVLAATDARAAGEGLGGMPARLRDRTLVVAVVYTLRTQLAAIGSVVLIPAIWFSVSYALTDLLAFDGASAPWSTSSKLVAGTRAKILKVLAIWYLAWTGLAILASLPFASLGEVLYALFFGGNLPLAAEFGVTATAVLSSAACALALRPILREREVLYADREARRKLQAGGAA